MTAAVTPFAPRPFRAREREAGHGRSNGNPSPK